MSKISRKTPVARDALIYDGVLYFEDVRQCRIDDPLFHEILEAGYTKAIRVISLDSDYVVSVYMGSGTFLKEHLNFEMTIRREVRSGRGHWYAYRRVFGKLHKRYVADDQTLDSETILKVAQRLPGVKAASKRK